MYNGYSSSTVETAKQCKDHKAFPFTKGCLKLLESTYYPVHTSWHSTCFMLHASKRNLINGIFFKDSLCQRSVNFRSVSAEMFEGCLWKCDKHNLILSFILFILCIVNWITNSISTNKYTLLCIVFLLLICPTCFSTVTILRKLKQSY